MFLAALLVIAKKKLEATPKSINEGRGKKKKFMKHYAVIKENYLPLAVVTPGVCIYVGLSLSIHIVYHKVFGEILGKNIIGKAIIIQYPLRLFLGS